MDLDVDSSLDLDLAIIGAGVAGLGAAYALRGAGVTVYERRETPGGRAATRRRGDCLYDVGANYLKSEDGGVNRLVRTLGTEDLVDVPEPVWTFDREGAIEPGDDPDEHKWTYRDGVAELGGRLQAAADAEWRFGTAVAAVREDGEGDEWLVETETGRESYDAVLCTPPGPVTADLLGGADVEGGDGGGDRGDARAALAEAAAAVPYRHVDSVALHYPEPLDRPWYGLVNGDHEHAVGWVSREECKAGHVPDGESLLIAQMGPEWSAERADADRDAVVAEAADLVADLLDEDRLADPDWTDLARWRHALADDAADPRPVARAADRGLFVAGDWVTGGPSRLHSSLRSGLDAAAAVAESAD
jgi:hypothetical protein